MYSLLVMQAYHTSTLYVNICKYAVRCSEEYFGQLSLQSTPISTCILVKVLENEERERDLLPIRLLTVHVLNFSIWRQLFYSYVMSVAKRVRIHSIFVVTFPITERNVAPAPLIDIII